MALPPFDDIKTDILSHTIEFTFSPSLWIDSNYINSFFDRLNMSSIKYFNNDCSGINEEISNLPNNKGGIYFFILKNDVLPNLSSHIMYIGRARNTEHQNLRKRCREYYNRYYNNPRERGHIYTMLRSWDKHLHLYYIELDDNDEIDSIEKKLINNILPPFNHDIPSATIRSVKNAIRAF